MKGIIVSIYSWIILAEVTTTMKILIGVASLLVILSACFFIRRSINRSTWRLVKVLGRSPDSVIEDLPNFERKVIKLEDYERDPIAEHRFISPVDTKLRIKETQGDNLNVCIYATSYPHLFNKRQIEEINEKILEIVSIKWSSHLLIVKKSPAADFFDFNLELKGIIFSQLHKTYASRFFPQRIKIVKVKDSNIELLFQDGCCNSIGDFGDLLLECESISDATLTISKDNLNLFRRPNLNWQKLKQDVLTVANDYFPAGVDWEGEWPEDETANEVDENQ